MPKVTQSSGLELRGLIPAPAQVRGAFRLVPLIRERPCEDVRLSKHAMAPGFKVVELPDRTQYSAFVPHALLLEWERPGHPLVSLGGQVGRPAQQEWRAFEVLDKLRKREKGGGLRFLPLHLALEGLLALHFAPPQIKWPELSRDFHRAGLGHRSEEGVPGHLLPSFDDALRTFEIHRGQVGMLVFAADQLAAAFVVPSMGDYKLLHHSLLQDLYGELVLRYAVLYPEPPLLEASPRFAQAKTVQDLYDALTAMRREWAEYTRETMLLDLLKRPLRLEEVYQPGPLKLERFVTELEPDQLNHIGERLTRQDGELLYLKTFLLSAAQTRRAYLLHQMARHEWHLERAAKALGHTTVHELVKRLEANGFGYLINQVIREQAAKALRPGRS